ncbi:hypothetical protein [Sphingomonas sp. 1P08PE]|uniref:hypothetical protein n=1 Tax=Sphingomonas sp. 1P08PE TaxID=554122 RepID=UPI00399FEAED
MVMQFDQIPIDRWPQKLDQDAAFLAVEPAELTARSAVRFAHDVDGLDEFEGALVRLEGQFTFALLHHLGSPVPGTKLVMQKLDNAVFGRILRFLAVQANDILWTADALKTGSVAGAPAPLGIIAKMRLERSIGRRNGSVIPPRHQSLHERIATRRHRRRA